MVTALPEAELTVAVDGNCIRVAGELDIFWAPRLKAALLDAEGPGVELDVDLSGVTYLDSAGMGVLIGCQRRLAAEGGRIARVRAKGQPWETLHVAGLHKFFAVERG